MYVTLNVCIYMVSFLYGFRRWVQKTQTSTAAAAAPAPAPKQKEVKCNPAPKKENKVAPSPRLRTAFAQRVDLVFKLAILEAFSPTALARATSRKAR